MNRSDYYRRAESWATDTRAASARSRRIAWIVAGVAVATAALEAVALAMLVPLKTVQPITLLVDKQTGYVQALDPQSPRRIVADDALTNSFLAQYVAAREGFDRATVSAAYRRVALWSAGSARQTYVAHMPATDPVSPFRSYPIGTVVAATIKSVSRLNPGLALVRFDTQLVDRSGRADPGRPWIATVRFRYVDAPMRFEDRLVNPLGFQVAGYRRDAEASLPPPQVQAAAASVSAPVQPTVVTTTTTIGTSAAPSSQSAPRLVPRQQGYSASPSRPAPSVSSQLPLGERREVPISQLPLGSPLSPAGSPVLLAGTSATQ